MILARRHRFKFDIGENADISEVLWGVLIFVVAVIFLVGWLWTRDFGAGLDVEEAVYACGRHVDYWSVLRPIRVRN